MWSFNLCLLLLAPVEGWQALWTPSALLGVLDTFGSLFRHLKHQNLSTCDYFINNIEKHFLVPFLTTKEAMVPLLNDPIMSGRSIQLFRHLESQNLCIGKSYGRIVSQAEKQRQRFVHHMEKAGKEFLKRKTINPTI